VGHDLLVHSAGVARRVHARSRDADSEHLREICRPRINRVGSGDIAYARAFDAVTYSLIGYLSDLSYARTGTRKPRVAGRLQTGEDLTGLYTAVFNFVQVSLRTGFDATAATQDVDGAFAIRLTAVILPVLGMALAGALFWKFPLTRAGVTEVQEGLPLAEARTSAAVTVTESTPAAPDGTLLHPASRSSPVL
jgi:hypothetical protein